MNIVLTKKAKIIIAVAAACAVAGAGGFALAKTVFAPKDEEQQSEAVSEQLADETTTLPETEQVSVPEYPEEEFESFASEGDALAAFAEENSSLGWDLSNPEACEGLTFDSNGKVTAIKLNFVDLHGVLNLGGFSELQSVSVSANYITAINLKGCVSLKYLDVSDNELTALNLSDCTALGELNCSFNDFSATGLNLSENKALRILECDNCGLTSLNVSLLTNLEELSCAFNKLRTIDINSNKKLTSFICCFNYLDIHEGGEFYQKLLDMMFDDVYVNYEPQDVPEDATFYSDEMAVLKAFAKSSNNNSSLDWLNGDELDYEKLQYNVLLEYDGTAYRVTAIDIEDCDVKGELDLSSFTNLEELYCENTGITSLNLKGCVNLATLDCANCRIKTLVLPGNASNMTTKLYYVDCEYNYIDPSIFTDEIVKAITFKAGATLYYEEQR